MRKLIILICALTLSSVILIGSDFDIENLEALGYMEFDQARSLEHTTRLYNLLSIYNYSAAVDSALAYISNSQSPVEQIVYYAFLSRAYLFNMDYENAKVSLIQMDDLCEIVDHTYFDCFVVSFWLAVKTGDNNSARHTLSFIDKSDLSLGPPTIGKQQIMQRAEIFIHLMEYERALDDLQYMKNHKTPFDCIALFDAAITVYKKNYSLGIQKIEILLEDASYDGYCRSYMSYLLAACYYQIGKVVFAYKYYDQAHNLLSDYHKPFLIDMSFHTFPIPIMEILDHLVASRRYN